MPSDRQLVSGKLDWGASQSAHLIAMSSLLAGFFIILSGVAPILRLGNSQLSVLAMALTLLAFALSKHVAHSIWLDCRQNSPFSFSNELITGIGIGWLVLLALLNFNPQSPIVDALVGTLWVSVGAGLLGISTWLGLALTKPATEQELAAADRLSVITYSDKTVSVSPTSLGQQPRQFNSLVMLLVSVVFWTTLEGPNSVRTISTIAMAMAGLTGLSTWQIEVQPARKIFNLKFSGIWGLESAFTINLHAFSRLEVVKLREGDMSWMQLVGYNKDITLPSAVIGTAKTDGESELGKALLDSCHLARHETTRDSIGLVGILLPQGAGILAGMAFVALGLGGLLFMPAPPRLVLPGCIMLMGVCLVSPVVARYILNLVAPTSLIPDPPRYVERLQAWEIGIALVIAFAVLKQAQGVAVLPLLGLGVAWLCFGIGACILTLVRRTPIFSKND
ncbi:MAG: hypothetical protein HC856_03730 [Pseudanabaena sp. RU_4_16]|nr:hypothetical protein [Pseudanabaena sp. RU_4_16]